MRVIWMLLIVLVLVTVGACSNAEFAAYNAWSMPHHVKQYSCGNVIGEWDSTGKIENEAHSDGYFFEDAATHKIVLISGEVQITLR